MKYSIQLDSKLRTAALALGVLIISGLAPTRGQESDLDEAADSELGNISTRGFVDIDENVMIGGFIVGDGTNTTVVVRAIGPSLGALGVTNPLLNPVLELHNNNGTQIAFDDDWKETQQAEIEAAGLAPTDDRESAIQAVVTPGLYTAIVRGKDNTTGVGLMEVYNLP